MALLKVNLNTYDNAWYNTGGSRIKRLLWHFISAIFFENSFFPVVVFKVFLLRLFGATIGQGIMLKPRLHIKYPWNITIDNFAWIGEDVWIDSLVSIKIGANVCISQGAYLLTGNHNFTKSTFDLILQPIVIEDGVWIGAKAVVCPGVVCKSHALLTVGSIASTHLEAYGIYRGNPAVRVKERIIQT